MIVWPTPTKFKRIHGFGADCTISGVYGARGTSVSFVVTCFSVEITSRIFGGGDADGARL